MTILCPSTRTPTPRVMKFTILVDPSLVIITTYLVCLIKDWEKRRFFKEIQQFYPKIPFPLGGGS